VTWLSLALTLLKIASTIITWARERELISQGYDQAIAEQAESILKKTEAGKAILERVNALSDDDVDAELRGLEPK
jgi:hypothetical protein